MGVVDIIVAAIILSILFAYAASTFFYQKKAASYTERIDNLRTLRAIMATVTRDLETAVEIVKPAYGTASYELAFRNDTYDLVRFVMVDEARQPLLTDGELREPLEQPNYVVRVTGAEALTSGRIVAKQCNRLHFVRFCRLGRNMMGIVVQLKRKDEGPGEERTLRLDSIVTIGSVLN